MSGAPVRVEDDGLLTEKEIEAARAEISRCVAEAREFARAAGVTLHPRIVAMRTALANRPTTCVEGESDAEAVRRVILASRPPR